MELGRTWEVGVPVTCRRIKALLRRRNHGMSLGLYSSGPSIQQLRPIVESVGLSTLPAENESAAMTIIHDAEQGRGRPRTHATEMERQAAHQESNRVILRDRQRVRRADERQAKIAAGTDRPVGRPKDLTEAERSEASRRRRRVTQYSFKDPYLETARAWREENPVRVAKMAEDWAEQVNLTAEAILREFAATKEEDRQALALELLDAEHRMITAAIRYSSVDQLVKIYAGV